MKRVAWKEINECFKGCHAWSLRISLLSAVAISFSRSGIPFTAAVVAGVASIGMQVGCFYCSWKVYSECFGSED